MNNEEIFNALNSIDTSLKSILQIEQTREQAEQSKLQSDQALLSKKFHIFEIPLLTANTEVKWTIPLGTKRFILQCRTNQDIWISTQQGAVATPLSPYLTLKAGTSWSEYDLKIDLLDVQSRVLFLASAGNNIIVEAIIWA